MLVFETLGFAKERSKPPVSAFGVEGVMLLLLESMALLQNPKSRLSSLLLPLDAGLLSGGLICSDKSGCAGKSSICSLFSSSGPLFLIQAVLLILVFYGVRNE